MRQKKKGGKRERKKNPATERRDTAESGESDVRWNESDGAGERKREVVIIAQTAS